MSKQERAIATLSIVPQSSLAPALRVHISRENGLCQHRASPPLCLDRASRAATRLAMAWCCMVTSAATTCAASYLWPWWDITSPLCACASQSIKTTTSSHHPPQAQHSHRTPPAAIDTPRSWQARCSSGRSCAQWPSSNKPENSVITQNLGLSHCTSKSRDQYRVIDGLLGREDLGTSAE